MEKSPSHNQEINGQIAADIMTYMAGMVRDKEKIAVEMTSLPQLKTLSLDEQEHIIPQLFFRFKKIILETHTEEELHNELREHFDQEVLRVLHVSELEEEMTHSSQEIHLGKIFSGVGLQEMIEEGAVRDVPASLMGKGNVKIPVVISGSLLKGKTGTTSGVVLVSKDLRQLQAYAKRRLDVITPVLQRAAAGDFSLKLHIPQEKDEFTEHVRVLNHMLINLKSMMEDAKQKSEELEAQNEELEEASAELEEAKTSLEEKVQERTQQLQNAKSGLEEVVIERTKELQELNKHLGQEVTHRTQELQKKLLELERFNKVAVGRELKMVELKEEVARLRVQINQSTLTTEQKEPS